MRTDGGAASVALGGAEAFAMPGDLAARIDATLPAGHDLVLGVRPEGIRVAREDGPGRKPMEAHFIEPLGAYDIVDLKLGQRYLKVRTASGFIGRPGERVWADLDAAQVHFFDATTGDALNIGQGNG